MLRLSIYENAETLSRYEGGFVDGSRSGRGILIFEDGSTFSGIFLVSYGSFASCEGWECLGHFAGGLPTTGVITDSSRARWDVAYSPDGAPLHCPPTPLHKVCGFVLYVP